METTELEFEIPFRLTNEPWNSFLTDTFKFHVWWILQPFGQGRRNLIPIFLFYLKTKIPSLRILKILEVKSLVISSILKSIQFLLSNSFLYRAKPREWWITIPLSRFSDTNSNDNSILSKTFCELNALWIQKILWMECWIQLPKDFVNSSRIQFLCNKTRDWNGSEFQFRPNHLANQMSH